MKPKSDFELVVDSVLAKTTRNLYPTNKFYDQWLHFLEQHLQKPHLTGNALLVSPLGSILTEVRRLRVVETAIKKIDLDDISRHLYVQKCWERIFMLFCEIPPDDVEMECLFSDVKAAFREFSPWLAKRGFSCIERVLDVNPVWKHAWRSVVEYPLDDDDVNTLWVYMLKREDEDEKVNFKPLKQLFLENFTRGQRRSVPDLMRIKACIKDDKLLHSTIENIFWTSRALLLIADRVPVSVIDQDSALRRDLSLFVVLIPV